MVKSNTIKVDDVRSFWDKNPLCASAIPCPLGTKEYFEFYDRLREQIESIEFSYYLHEYQNFTGRKVLDVGSGNGYVLSKYTQEGANVYGIDITSTAISLCERRFELLGLDGNFRVANAEELPFEDEYFDCVCSMGVLHHTPDTEKAISEIFRVLKPGGRVILMFYHKDSAQYRFKYPLLRLITGKTLQQLVNEFDGVGNPKGFVYSKTQLKQLLNGFQQLNLFVGYLTGWMLLPKGGRFIPKQLLKLFEKKWGWNLYAKGIKSYKSEESN